MALDWLPIYPDPIRRPSRLAALDRPFTTGLLPIATLPAAPLAWQPSYPASASGMRLGLLAPWQTSGAASFRPVVPVPSLSWRAIYPDRLLPPAQSILTTGTSLFTGGLVLAPYRSWAPSYPDFAQGSRLPASLVPFFTEISPSPFTITDGRWHPTYPDRLPPAARLASPPSYVSTVSPITNPPPTIDWAPKYPDRPTNRLVLSLRTNSQRTFTGNLVPIPNAAAPSQSWQQVFQFPPRSLPTRTGTYQYNPVPFSVATVLVSIPWQGRSPDPIRLRPVQPPPPSFPFSSLVQIGVVGGWRGTYPDRLARAPQTPTGGSWWRVDALTLLGAAACLELETETLVSPTVQTETVLSPTFASESLVDPTLGGETLC